MSRIAVIGAGAWGTALAIVLGRKGTHRVRLWAHETEVCQAIQHKRINEPFLPGCLIPSISATVACRLLVLPTPLAGSRYTMPHPCKARFIFSTHD